MKKLWNILVLMLAINFLALAGVVGWLWQGGRLDAARVKAIKAVLFPAPEVAAPTTQPSEADGPAPASQRLEDLLAKVAGKRTAAEQVEIIQQTLDTTVAQLDRRQKEVEDLERQVAEENRRLTEDRKALDEDKRRLAEREGESERLAGDKGFQDTLTLYNAMPAKQVKTVFASLDDDTVARYLDAMTPRTAAKIIKEFKSPQEADRIKRVLEKMRGAQPAATAAVPKE